MMCLALDALMVSMIGPLLFQGVVPHYSSCPSSTRTMLHADTRELLLLLPPAERHRHVLVKQQPVFAALFQHRRVPPRHLLGAAGFLGQFATPRSRCPRLVAVAIHAQVVV